MNDHTDCHFEARFVRREISPTRCGRFLAEFTLNEANVLEMTGTELR